MFYFLPIVTLAVSMFAGGFVFDTFIQDNLCHGDGCVLPFILLLLVIPACVFLASIFVTISLTDRSY